MIIRPDLRAEIGAAMAKLNEHLEAIDNAEGPGTPTLVRIHLPLARQEVQWLAALLARFEAQIS